MIRYTCPNCNRLLESPDHGAGAKLACPQCGQRLQIPVPAAKPAALDKTKLAPLADRPSGPAAATSPPLAASPSAASTPPGTKPASAAILKRKVLLASCVVTACLAACILYFWKPARPEAAGETAAAPKADAPKALDYQKTLDYWKKAKVIADGCKPKGGAADRAAALRGAADQIKAMPTLGVDLDAVRGMLRLVALFRRAADHVERSNQLGTAADVVVEQFLTGLSFGHYQGKTYEGLRGEERAIVKEVQEVSHDLATLRATLTQRYEVEFP